MKRPHTAEFIEATAFICIVAAMCIAWYYGYVKPADEMRYQIMDCMHERGDRSEAGYRHCFQELKEGRGK
tara:strand:+ start:1382 stop:1591 length:210 start_codon:yes stop_codon:yes gene_type:complete